jgi:hypothetical protein
MQVSSSNSLISLAMTVQRSDRSGGAVLLPPRPFNLIWHVGWNKIPSGVSREASVRLLRALKSGYQGCVQCDSHGTFGTRGTVRTRRSGSIKRTQGPAADRAASHKGFVERHTLNSQQEEYVLTAIGKKVLANK